MGKALVTLTVQALEQLLGLEEGMRIVYCMHRPDRDSLHIVVESPLFEEVPEGSELPSHRLERTNIRDTGVEL